MLIQGTVCEWLYWETVVYVCAYQEDSLSDWTWTLWFAWKMASDGIHIVVAQWDQVNPIMQNVLEIPQQSIAIQSTNQLLHELIMPNKKC